MISQHGQSLPDWVQVGLRKDPAFRVISMDGNGWIDPFSGELVPAAQGYEEAAIAHLRRSQSWRSGQAKPLRDLLYLRWLYYLRGHLQELPQLRILRSGRWLNPYTGRWQPGPPEVWASDLNQMATFLAGVLCDSPEAQAGRMLERWQLDSLASKGPEGIDPGPIAMPGAPPASARTATPVRNAKVAEPKAARPAPARQVLPEATPVRGHSVGRTKMKTDLVGIRQTFLKQLRRPPRIEGYQLVLQFAPNATLPRDFYDFVAVGDTSVHIVLGHVTGDGPGAALLAGAMVDAVRALGAKHSDGVDLLCAVNEAVRVDQVPGCAVPACVLTLDYRSGRMRCVVAGHPPPIIASARRDTILRQFRAGGGALGTLHGADFRKRLQAVEAELAAGDVVVLLGMGLAHAADPSDPDAGRWKAFGQVVSHLKRPLAELVPAVMQGLRGEERPREDMAIIALRTKDESWLLESKD